MDLGPEDGAVGCLPACLPACLGSLRPMGSDGLDKSGGLIPRLIKKVKAAGKGAKAAMLVGTPRACARPKAARWAA